MRSALLAVAVLALVPACTRDTAPPAPSPAPSATVTSTPTASPTPTPTLSPSPSPSARPTRTATTRPSPSATVASRATLLWKVPTTRRVVALTFDAGSDVGSAARILDLLRAEGIRASFGVTGRWARENPALVRRMATEGHLLVNHTDQHLSFTGFSTKSAPLSREGRLAALAGAEAAVREAAGVSTKPWFRPPYGDRDASVDRDVASAGYRYALMWTVDTLGWKGVAPAEVVRRVMDRLTPGEIVLMHVGAASTDDEALPETIRRLRAAGYGFVRADGR